VREAKPTVQIKRVLDTNEEEYVPFNTSVCTEKIGEAINKILTRLLIYFCVSVSSTVHIA
jgi:hypothetical protein